MGSPVTLPATRKKGNTPRIPAITGSHDKSVGFAKSRRSYDRLGCDGEALWRQRGLDGDDRRRREKQRKEKERRRRRPGLYNAVKAHGNGAQQLLHASATPKLATSAPGTEKKAAGDEVASVATVPHIYRIPIRQNLQITPKFM